MSSSGPSTEPDLSGTVLGRHRLLRRLGAGGMGSVYLAQHEHLDRQVAIKVLHPSRAANPSARKRFLREARAASKVRHPGVVEIHDVAISGDHVYFVMEPLPGQDLRQRLELEGRLPWSQAQPLLLQIAQALHAAHDAGVVHRDVKPSNCMLVPTPDGGEERVKVVDFGIAKVAAEERTLVDELTATGEVLGTVSYLAPEMADGGSDDPRSDVYAFGVLMFRVLTGRLPFVGAATHVLAQHITKPPPAPRSLEPSIPAPVERLILHCLEKKPDARPASMLHVANVLSSQAPSSSPRSSARSLAPAAAPPPAQAPALPASITPADLVDLDARPNVPPPSDAFADEPPPPPMPGELDPSLFRPPPDPKLELELAHPAEHPPAPPSRRSLLLPLVTLTALVVLGAATWAYRDAIVDAAPQPSDVLPSEPEEPVLLLIDTTPKNAEIYLDDVRTSERPIRVPRSDIHLRVRVQAPGYEPRTIQVQPLRTRRLEVKLDRAKRSP